MKEVTNELEALYDFDTEAVSEEELEHFVCQQCGRCCCWPGYVRIDQDEVDTIAEYLEMDVREFTDSCTKLTDDRRSLTILEKANGHCIFYDQEDGCLINPVKPQQCIDFPRAWNFERWNELCRWGVENTRSKAERRGDRDEDATS